MTIPNFVCQIDEGQMDDDGCGDETHEHYGPRPPPDGPINGKTSEGLISALSTELKEMVQVPLTHSSLNQISRFANIAQELIMVRSPIADVRQRKRPRYASGGISVPYQGGPYSDPNPVIGGSGYPLEENALTGEAAPNETFGAKLVRELIPALTNATNKGGAKKGIFEDLVDGIAAARDKGLDDVADSLQKKLDALGDVGAKVVESEIEDPQPAFEEGQEAVQ